MIEIEGKYNKAKIFTDNIDSLAISQIIEMLNEEFIKDSKVRIMPDVHPGKGCTIGTTMTITDKVVPNLVGVDISWGITTFNLGKVDIDFKLLDEFVRENIPHGHNVHNDEKEFKRLDDLRCVSHINKNRALRSIGSLGGGNHYIEIGKDDDNTLYLMIHSGSRYLGKQVAEYYQNLAYGLLKVKDDNLPLIIQKLKAEKRHSKIEETINKYRENKPKKVNKDLAYLTGNDLKDYLYDMDIVKEYASHNRLTMGLDILNFLELSPKETINTIHNYIDTDTNILRKGAISAELGEVVLIPINMRDGSILARGKGNPDWNFSAPHGAGRLFSRGQAKKQVSLEGFIETMKGVYSSSVREDTIDESPFAYKPMSEILENTKDTIDIISIIKPLYNFKA